MENKYEEKLQAIIIKHSKTLFNYEYEKIIPEIIDLYKKTTNVLDYNDRKVYEKLTCSILFDFIINLNKRQIKEYLKLLKKYMDFNKSKKIFLKLHINLYMIKNKKYTYFKKMYAPKLSNKIRKKIKLFILKKDEKFLNRLKVFLPNKLYIDYLELVITTKCTLKCKNCANLMPLYKCSENIDKEIILESIKKIKECVDEVSVFRILGGEPFCNPDLKLFLKELTSDKFKKVIIVTNGTLVPKDKELLKIIKEQKIGISISNYGKHSYKLEELVKFCKKEKIEYNVDPLNKFWYDFGTLELKEKTKKELKKQFLNCNLPCKSILKGSIYLCPRQSHGIDLGKIKKVDGQYVDIISNDKKTNKKRLKKLFLRNSYIEACKYCDYATSDCKIIPVAEQIKKG